MGDEGRNEAKALASDLYSTYKELAEYGPGPHGRPLGWDQIWVDKIMDFKRQVEKETFNKVLGYQRMRICMADKSRCVEVLAGNVVKEAIENGAIAEQRGLETWIREQQAKDGA